MWLFYAQRAFDVADERRREADQWRLARDLQQEGPGPIRHAAAHLAAATGGAFERLARAIDLRVIDERRA